MTRAATFPSLKYWNKRGKAMAAIAVKQHKGVPGMSFLDAVQYGLQTGNLAPLDAIMEKAKSAPPIDFTPRPAPAAAAPPRARKRLPAIIAAPQPAKPARGPRKRLSEDEAPRQRKRVAWEDRAERWVPASGWATCQCCDRQVKAMRGLIAHHGFTRPTEHWQTASCFGARRLPWEVSRKRLGELIAWLEREVRQLEDQLALVLVNKELQVPVQIRQRKGHMIWDTTNLVVTSKNFEALRKEWEREFVSRRFHKWSDVIAGHKTRLVRKLEQIESELAALRKRHAGWKENV